MAKIDFLKLAKEAARIADEKKAVNTVILDVKNLCYQSESKWRPEFWQLPYELAPYQLPNDPASNLPSVLGIRSATPVPQPESEQFPHRSAPPAECQHQACSDSPGRLLSSAAK